MQAPAPVKSRKLLVASLGVASMTYVATTTLLPACGGSTASQSKGGDSGQTGDSAQASDSMSLDDFPVANLAVMPESGMQNDAPTDSLQIDDFPVANLAVMPDAGMSDAGNG